MTEGSPLRAATLPTFPFWGGFARGTCSNLSPLKGEMSQSDRRVSHLSEQLRCPPPLSREALQKGQCHAVTEGSPLRAASLPTSSFWGGFAKGAMSRSDRGVTSPRSFAAHLPFRGRLYKNKNSRVHRLNVPAVFCSHVKLCDSSSMDF